MTEKPLFDTVKQEKKEPQRDRWGRYMLTHPDTGETQSWMRTTTFAKMASDTFNLTQWQMRNVAIGLSRRQDLLALASTLDVSKDAKKLNGICNDAKEAAGASSAANTGTALHSFTELADGGEMSDVPEAYRPRIAEYQATLRAHNIEILPQYIERVSVSTRYEVAGTYDRVVRLDDGSHCIFDLKTGRDLSYGMDEIAIQLAVYANAVNHAGVWNFETGTWEAHPPVREDFALVAHMPSQGSGCHIYRVNLIEGARGADLCDMIRAWRKTKNVGTLIPTVVKPSNEEEAWGVRMECAETVEELIGVADAAREAGAWTPRLRSAALLRRKQIEAGK